MALRLYFNVRLYFSLKEEEETNKRNKNKKKDKQQ